MNISQEQLTSLIQRIERLEEEKRNVSDDIKGVYQEAKSQGFDPKIIRQIIKLRAKDASEIEEEEYLLDVYKKALGTELRCKKTIEMF